MGATKHINSVRPDKKGRVTLGPLREAWLYENAEALDAVRQGLRESADGELHDLGSFAEPDGDDASSQRSLP